MARWQGAWLPLPLLVACTLNSTGAGSGAGANVGDGPGDSTGSTTGTETTGEAGQTSAVDEAGDTRSSGGNTADDTTGASNPTDADTNESSSSTGQSAGGPVLEISDGATFDFGPVPVSTTDVHVFVVTNVGDEPAEAIAGQSLGGAFDYEGGTYPGTSGNCGATLDIGTSCDVAVAFVPTQLGLYDQELRLDYDDGASVARPLTGGGAGTSGNLLSNPGGEDGGTPPNAWNDIDDGTWVTANWIVPHSGNSFISADLGPNETFRLSQWVPVDAWSSTIDAGAMRFSFVGWAATWDDGNDEHRIRVRYRDASGSELESWGSGWSTGIAWTQLDNERLAPVGTRTVEVELSCRKSGGDYCDAYYDSLSLEAVYP